MKIRSILLAFALISAFLLAVWYFSNIFWYVVISLVLSTMFRSLTNRINRTQVFNMPIPRVVGVLVSFALLVLIISSFIVVFLPLVSEQAQILAGLNYHNVFDRLSQPTHAIEEFLLENNLVEEEPGFLADNLWAAITSFAGSINFRSIVNEMVNFATSFFVAIMAITFITFMLLYEKGLFKKSLIKMIPNQYFELMIAAVYKIEKLLSSYLIGLFLQLISIFSMAALGLSIFGIKYALSIALFAAVANIIPYAGPLLGAMFGIMVGLSTGETQFGTPEATVRTLEIISVFAVVQLTDNLVIQPLIFSKSVKAHPLEIFVIIFAGATVGGIIGMIVSIPTYTILRVSVMELYHGYRGYRIFRI